MIKKEDWMEIAKKEIGIKEIPGPKANSKIVEYASKTSLHATDDETPWCSAFVNWTMDKAGYKGTNNAMARSWLKWGEELDEAKPGCIVIFSREGSPSSGHVGFVVEDRVDILLVLGGNQKDQVCISKYTKNRVLGYRWPREEDRKVV